MLLHNTIKTTCLLSATAISSQPSVPPVPPVQGTDSTTIGRRNVNVGHNVEHVQQEPRQIGEFEERLRNIYLEKNIDVDEFFSGNDVCLLFVFEYYLNINKYCRCRPVRETVGLSFSFGIL